MVCRRRCVQQRDVSSVFCCIRIKSGFQFAGEKQAWKSHRYDPAKRWVERSGKRTKVTYVVEFSTSDERVFMTRKGWCWHEEYAKCASLILKEARVAARQITALAAGSTFHLISTVGRVIALYGSASNFSQTEHRLCQPISLLPDRLFKTGFIRNF